MIVHLVDRFLSFTPTSFKPASFTPISFLCVQNFVICSSSTLQRDFDGSSGITIAESARGMVRTLSIDTVLLTLVLLAYFLSTLNLRDPHILAFFLFSIASPKLCSNSFTSSTPRISAALPLSAGLYAK